MVKREWVEKVLTTSARDWAKSNPTQQEKRPLPAVKRVARPPTAKQVLRKFKSEGED